MTVNPFLKGYDILPQSNSLYFKGNSKFGRRMNNLLGKDWLYTSMAIKESAPTENQNTTYFEV